MRNKTVGQEEGPLLILTRCPPPPLSGQECSPAFTLSPSMIQLCPTSLSHLSFPAARLIGSLLPAWPPQSQLPTLRNAFLRPPCVLMQILPSLQSQAGGNFFKFLLTTTATGALWTLNSQGKFHLQTPG